MPPLDPLARKVLLIGWDAADWRVIDPLLAQGKMPNLASLVSGGVRGNISTLYPALSPMLWTSIATGKRPFKHGIHGFSEPTPDGRSVRPITNLSRTAKAVWNILHQSGNTSNVVGWWPSHPAEPIRGAMVSNHYQQVRGPLGQPWPMAEGTVHPARLAKRLEEFRLHPGELDGSHIAPFVPHMEEIDQEKDQRLETIARLVAEITSIHGAATALMQLEPWDFMAVYFDGIDHFSHVFMRYHPPRQAWVDERDYELYQSVIEAAYRYHDMMLGTLLALAGEDTTVILMSDHGFHPDRNRLRNIPVEPAGPAMEHRHYGILALRGPGISKGERIYGSSVLDICPTILRLFGLPQGYDMDGKVLVTAFEEAPRLATIPSWDQVEGDAGTHPPGMQLDTVQAAEAMQQMIDLGYIEPLPENREAAVRSTIRELRYNLARAYMDGGRFADAAELCRQLWDEWPDEHRFGIGLAGCLAALRDGDRRRQAIDRLERSMAECARRATEALAAHRARNVDQDPAKLSESERYELRRLRALASPDLETLAYLKSFEHLAAGRFAEAAADLERVQNLEDASTALQVRLGHALLKTANWDRAAACFQAALAQDPDLVEGHLGLALVAEGRGDFPAMLDAALAATGLIFHNPRGHVLVGEALLHVEKYDDAEQAFQLALHQHPTNRQALRGLIKLYRDCRPDEFKLNSHYLRMSVLREQLRQHARAGRKIAARAAAPEPELVAVPVRTESRPAGPPDRVVSVVSGLPRSGTSMMMQILAAGGMVAYTDDRRAPDSDNPLGYFEHDLAARLASDGTWLPEVRGKVVKIVAPLLPRLPASESYAIVLMHRDLSEVVASQRRMLDRLNRKGASLSDAQLMEALRREVERVERWISTQTGVRVLNLDYGEVLDDPPASCRKLAEFFDRPLDLASMEQAVLPALRRQHGSS